MAIPERLKNSKRPEKNKKIRDNEKDVQYFFPLKLSPELNETVLELRQTMDATKTRIFEYGVKYLWNLQKDIEARIFVGDYVPAHLRKRFGKVTQIKVKPFSHSYPIRIYHMEYLDKKKVHVFYKQEDDPQDGQFRIIKVLTKSIRNEVLALFPPDTNLTPLGK